MYLNQLQVRFKIIFEFRQISEIAAGKANCNNTYVCVIDFMNLLALNVPFNLVVIYIKMASLHGEKIHQISTPIYIQ